MSIEWENYYGESFQHVVDDLTSGLIRVPVAELNVFNMGKGIHGVWSAPVGWNDYVARGNFTGCRPIIKSGARINTKAFEAINFEMA